MAPEAPGNLVVLDLHYDQKNDLLKTVETVGPPQTELVTGWLRVRFDEAPDEGFYPVGQGVAHVRQPDRYEHDGPGKEERVLTLPGVRRYRVTNVAQGDGLQLILILPQGYSLTEFSPAPSNAKEFAGRVAVYFRPKERYGETAEVIWGLRTFQGSAESEAKRLRGRITKTGKLSRNAGALVDREDPDFKEVGGKHHPMAEPPLSQRAYAMIALVAGAIGIGLMVFYIYQVPKLEADVRNQVYYVVLFPSAVACSVALFGVMRSYARFRGKHFGGVLELGGPVVLFCLLVAGGFKLVPAAPETFDLTVRPHSADGRDPIVTSGRITIDLDTDRRSEPIGATGEADFKGIPPRFQGATLKILPQVEGYEEQWQRHKLHGNVLELPLVRITQPVTRFVGSIVPPPANWRDLRVTVEGQTAEGKVDERGHFGLDVNGKDGDGVQLRIYAGQAIVYDDSQVLPGPVTVTLHSPR